MRNAVLLLLLALCLPVCAQHAASSKGRRAWSVGKGVITDPDNHMRRTPPHAHANLSAEPKLAPFPTREEEAARSVPAQENRKVGGYVNRVTAQEPAYKAAGNIIICGRGSQTRAFSPFNSLRERCEEYAAVANRYKDIFGPDVRVYCMPIPIAVEYYCPDAAREWTGSCARAVNNIFAALRTDVVAVDVYTTLGQHAAEPIYSRTDHHWSPLGAYYAAERFAALAGVPFRDLSCYESDTVRNFVGTMYKFSKDISVKNAPEDFVFYRPTQVEYATTFIDYTLDSRRKYVTGESEPREGNFFRHYDDGSGAAYSTFMGGDAKLTHVHTSTPGGRRLLILKDSFGNALPGYLFYSFEDIHVVDCRYFTKNLRDYVRDNHITDILFANNLQHACTPATTEKYYQYLTQ
ncbi:MAG: hypothetical protein IJ692_03590 [Alloprevotella sp.]|nr:hypothetical protein [Alloprevotella sp.]